VVDTKPNTSFRLEKAARFRLGAAPIGNLFSAMTGETAGDVLAACAEAGCRSIDTAPYYGHGLSETRLGTWLRRSSQNFRISTKVGRRLIPCDATAIPDHGFIEASASTPVFDYSGDGIRRTFDESLDRLGVDQVESLLLHDVGRLTHGVAHQAVLRQVMDEALPVMERMRATGRIDRIGVGVNEVEIAETLLATSLIDVVLIAGRYTLLDRSATSLLDECARRGVAVLVGGVYNSGLLAGGTTFDYRQANAVELARRDRLAMICARHHVPLAAAALAFPFRHRAVAQIVVGLRSVAEVDATMRYLNTVIPDALWDELDQHDGQPSC
jgi:D-threo-aldose 1-dehydrogenase